MRTILALTLVFSVLTNSGCGTGIDVQHLSNTNVSVTGVPWNLPMTQFTVTITRHVTGCVGALTGSVEVMPVAGTAVDPDQQYVLSSNGWLSTSDITSKLAASGVSTSLNAKSVSKVGNVISNVLGAVGKVSAGLVSAAAESFAKNQPKQKIKESLQQQLKSTNVCQANVANAVAELYPSAGLTLNERVKKDTADLAEATAKLAHFTALEQIDSSYKKDLIKEAVAQEKARSVLKRDSDRLKRDLAITTDKQVIKWPTRGSQYRTVEPYAISGATLSKWKNKDISPTISGIAANVFKMAREQFNVYFALYDLAANQKSWEPPEGKDSQHCCKGIPIRLAKPARLVMCVGSKCPKMISTEHALPKNQTASAVTVLQMGRTYYLPAEGGYFRSETAVIALDSNGMPKSMEIAENAAVAAELSGAVKDAATQLSESPADIRPAAIAKIQAQTSQNNANAALISALTPTETHDQTDTLTAQIKLINAQKSLATARQNAGIPLQTAAVTNQTALLNAQSALIKSLTEAQVVDKTSVIDAQASLLNAQAAQINAVTSLAMVKSMVDQ